MRPLRPALSPRRLALAAAATSLVAATGLAGPAYGSPATTGAAAGPLRYVALGDSYSAGSGILPFDPAAPLPCLRTTSNYPHVIAATTGARLTDVTCGAAQTKDFRAAQYPGITKPQLDAVTRDAQLVTMTIGGNDSNTFIGAIVACGVAGAATLGQGSPCKDLYGTRFEDTVRSTTYPAVRQALSDVRAKAPNAKVAILGYPWILPKTEGCFTKMPVARGDVPYLRSLQTTLNAVIKKAAADTGATYVDLSKVSEGKDACSPATSRWVEPVLFGTNIVPVHPNALGEAGMATQALKVLKLR